MHAYLNVATDAARKAGRYIMRSYDKGLKPKQITLKSPKDFVTDIDKRAEEIIIEVLKEAYPDHSFLGEECGFIEGKNPNKVWVIDPLDGTKNFIHGYPHFAISIAYKFRDTVEHGLIYNPIDHNLFTATKGKGAQLNDKKIRVSGTLKLDNALLSGTAPGTKAFKSEYNEVFAALSQNSNGFRRSGSVALDLAYVAAGYIDGFWDTKAKEWDMAAGALIVREAGGVVSNIKGGVDFIQSENIIAGTPKIFKSLVQQIAPHVVTPD